MNNDAASKSINITLGLRALVTAHPTLNVQRVVDEMTKFLTAYLARREWALVPVVSADVEAPRTTALVAGESGYLEEEFCTRKYAEKLLASSGNIEEWVG